MKILYDHQAFEMQKIGGISRYFREILGGVGKLDEVAVELAIKYSDNEYLKKSEFSAKIECKPDTYESFCGGREFKGKWTLFNLRNKVFNFVESESINKELSIKALQAQDFDVFHATYYDDYFLPYLGEKPFVLTIHDMIHEIYPEYFSLGDQTARRKRALALRAERIIAISDCTKKDIVQILGLPPEKVDVVYHSNSIGCELEHRMTPLNLPSRYLLFVGSRTGYKNFYSFFNSISPLLRKDETLHLVCVGATFSNTEMTFLDHHGLSGKVHSRFVDDAELRALYAQALAFVFPSLYEGFGLPVLEAFSCGCAAILSDSSSLPEIGGNAAIYFDPKDANSICTNISKVIYSDQTRFELIELGYKRAKLFSWEKACKDTALVYRKVYEN